MGSSGSSSLMVRKILQLVENRKICKLFIWREEPSRFSWSLIEAFEGNLLLVNVFDNCGTYEGIRLLPIDYVHLLMTGDFPEFQVRGRELLPVEQALSDYSGCVTREKFLARAADLGEVCEVFMNDMESHIGIVADFDDDYVVLHHFNNETLEIEGEIVIASDDVHYFWARSRNSIARTKLLARRIPSLDEQPDEG